ncbi:MAG: hypothetical protein WBY88_06135 [Desulfosarcina sp.]
MHANLRKAIVADPLRTVCWAQGAYYVVTGMWPLLHIDSFQAVTGPKDDLWLVNTVGWLLILVGAVLLLAAFRRTVGLEMAVLGIGSALVLAAVDIIYAMRDVISAIYLLDAVVEIAFAAAWVAGGLKSKWKTRKLAPRRSI